MNTREEKPILCPSGEDFIPCSEEDLAEVESILGATLPRDYKEFVMKYGWSHYEPSAVVKTIEKPPSDVTIDDESTVLIGNFFGGDYKGTSLLFHLKISPMYEFFPKQMLAIADDVMTNQFLLGLAGEERNKIFFWYREGLIEPEHYEEDGLAVPDDWKYRNLTLVANSLSDLFESIQPEQ